MYIFYVVKKTKTGLYPEEVPFIVERARKARAMNLESESYKPHNIAVKRCIVKNAWSSRIRYAGKHAP